MLSKQIYKRMDKYLSKQIYIYRNKSIIMFREFVILNLDPQKYG